MGNKFHGRSTLNAELEKDWTSVEIITQGSVEDYKQKLEEGWHKKRNGESLGKYL